MPTKKLRRPHPPTPRHLNGPISQSVDLAPALDGVRFIGTVLEVGLDTALCPGLGLGVAFPERRAHLEDLAVHRLIRLHNRRGWSTQRVGDVNDMLRSHQLTEPDRD